MAYSSTLVTYGTATGVVTATGDNTEIGCISELIAGAEVLATPLTRKIARISAADSAVPVWVMPADEESIIARHTWRIARLQARAHAAIRSIPPEA